MKYCPTCKTRYDEDILRFCMKDGTPLIDEAEPQFTTMPSASIEQVEADDDPDEVTVIRKKGEIPIPPPEMDEEGGFIPPAAEYRPQEPVFRPKEEPAPRIVVPMQDVHAGARVIPPYQQPPRKSNTAMVVVLTIFGTVALLVVGALGFWAISRGLSENGNSNANNTNANVMINTNLGFDSNFNFNGSNSLFDSNASVNTNVNANANVKSPTPTPRPSPSPSPTPSATPDDDTDLPTPTPRPSASVPTMMPVNRPSPTPPRMLPTNRNANRPTNN